MPEEQLKKFMEFCSKPENAEIAEYIKKKGVYNKATGEFILTGETGNKVIFKIDDLVNNTVDFSSVFSHKEQKPEMIEESAPSEVPSSVPVEEDDIEEILDENISTKAVTPTLYDFNNAINEKNIEKVDNMLSTFAINPNTGLVDINIAISTVTNNTLNEAVNCVSSNTSFSTDLTHYSLDGKAMKKQDELAEPVNISDVCDRSFNNILLFAKAAVLKGISYSEENQARAKITYTTRFNDRLNVLGLNKPSPEVKNNDNNVVQPESPEVSKELALRPTKDLKKAGFADVFILSMIVIVYAIIIVNLVMKLR